MLDDFMLDDIIRMTLELKKQMQSQLPIIDKQINTIIQTKEESPQVIESVLDILLDYSLMGVGDDQFKKLNKYYATFNFSNAATYTRFYEED